MKEKEYYRMHEAIDEGFVKFRNHIHKNAVPQGSDLLNAYEFYRQKYDDAIIEIEELQEELKKYRK